MSLDTVEIAMPRELQGDGHVAWMLEMRYEYRALAVKSLEIDYRGFCGSKVCYGRLMKWTILSQRGFVFRCVNVSGSAIEEFNVKNTSII
jgi:hypothetical protein